MNQNVIANEAKHRTSFHLPLVRATEESLRGFGTLVDDAKDWRIEIVRWPAPGWRPVDPGTGDEGGTTEGVFEFEWNRGTLRGANSAVGDEYVLGWSFDPESDAPPDVGAARADVYMRHANYHPDGGQLFFPLDEGPFVAPLALPGDDVRPKSFMAFWCDGARGLYIHPGVWHEALFPVRDKQRFFDKQGKVHARISVDFKKEFGCYLVAPLGEPS